MTENRTDPYAKRMAKIASATPEQLTKMSPKQLATYQGAVSWLREAQQMEAAEAAAKAQAAAALYEARIAAARSRFEVPKVSKGQVAAFLWMPQLNLSFQAFTFPLALLVQTFAQILVAVALLPDNHPARSFSGAKAYGLMQLLEEARIGLPRLSSLWTGGARIPATRQYAVFASTIGVLATGALTILTMFTNVFFGAAKAFAQAPLNPSITYTQTGDLGLGFINAIFDFNQANVVSSGLGDLFAFYSSTMLIFAGLIVLWIIISAVAETARTGIPFGKQFNHVWAPIRLIAAVGLLVPLGSGLNSGQHLIIGLTKWGSDQAKQMWVEFADRSAIAGSAAGVSATTNSVLNSIPTARDQYKAVADQMFDVMLCQALWNQYNKADPSQRMNVNESQFAPKEGISVAGADGTQKKLSTSNYVATKLDWSNSELNCGNAVVAQIKQADATDAASTTAKSMFESHAKELNAYSNLSANLAYAVADAALNAQDNLNEMYGQMNYSMPGFWDEYSKLSELYADARSANISQQLQVYNQSVGRNFQDDAKNLGWISAPIWLNRIAEQNGRVLDVAVTVPQVTGPQNAATNAKIGSAWNVAQQFMYEARKVSADPAPDSMQAATSLMRATFKEILAPNNNPLGTISSYGRNLMGQGVRLTFLAGTINENTNKPYTCGQAAGSCSKDEQKAYEEAQEARKTRYNSLILGISGLANQSGGVESPVNLAPGNAPWEANEEIRKFMQNSMGDIPVTVFRPLGSMLISFGFMMGYVLPLLPFFRFMLGVLGWVLLLFEALLAVPLLAISLLKTDGEGFMTQNFQTGAVMVLGLVLRPIFMIFGLLLGLLAFNGIMNIANVSYIATIGPIADNSVLSMFVYLIVYGMLAYTLANSAFKAIDILPNQVMSWLGARLDQRVDDASMIHSQASGMVSNIGMVSAMGGGMGAPKNADESGTNPPLTGQGQAAQQGNTKGPSSKPLGK